MKILALGATGAIGSGLIECLSQAQHEIHVTTRRLRTSSRTVRYIQGNAQDDSFLNQVLRTDWDVIVDFMVYDTARFRHRRDILLGATGQYIFTSTARIFADSLLPITEQSPRLLDVCTDNAYLATDEYALTKARQEDLLRSSKGNNWTIVRPYITFGEGRLQLGTLEKESWLYRALQGRSIIFCDAMMEKYTTLTDSSDVARMFAALAGNPAALGEDYNLAGDIAVPWGEVVTLYLDVLEASLGTRPRFVLQNLDSFCHSARSVPQIKYDRLYDRRFNPAKIRNLLGSVIFEDFRTALKERLRTQLAMGEFKPIDWRGEALRDRASREHTRLREIGERKSKLRYLGYRYVPLELKKILRP